MPAQVIRLEPVYVSVPSTPSAPELVPPIADPPATRGAVGAADAADAPRTPEARSGSREPAWRSLLRRGRRARRRGDENALGEVLYALRALGTAEASAAAVELTSRGAEPGEPTSAPTSAPSQETALVGDPSAPSS
jgi:hypothetical protein